jgi:hypothetical protein
VGSPTRAQEGTVRKEQGRCVHTRRPEQAPGEVEGVRGVSPQVLDFHPYERSEPGGGRFRG